MDLVRKRGRFSAVIALLLSISVPGVAPASIALACKDAPIRCHTTPAVESAAEVKADKPEMPCHGSKKKVEARAEKPGSKCCCGSGASLRSRTCGCRNHSYDASAASERTIPRPLWTEIYSPAWEAGHELAVVTRLSTAEAPDTPPPITSI